MTHAEYAEGLRLIADFFEAHPELPIPSYEFPYHVIHSKENTRLLIKALGSCEKTYSDFLGINKYFGPIKFHAMTVRRDAICKKVVTGKRKIEIEIPLTVEKRIIEEDIIEWRCSDAALLETEHA